MKISDIIESKNITVSCELFPPKAGTGLEKSKAIVARTAALKPDFISVTYGAAGSTAGYTAELAEEVGKNGVSALAHVTCVSCDEEILQNYLSVLKKCGIENVLALRGDMPEGREPMRVFKHASDLITRIKQSGDFCVGGACYPECHPESASREADLYALKNKAECGCDFFTTQMFFDNEIMYSFLTKLRAIGVFTPVIAGIMPIVSVNQIQRTVALSGTVLPRRFIVMAERFGDDPAAMRQAGIAYATEQIVDLIANGVNNIHIYTMNRPDIAGAIINNLSEIR
ncbi:MAG: methylenetetrahydrofolate reductase [Clostridia bacterium]|nr:methylenetetrahydrofolate reductase [Clostridia bacterium]